MSNLTHYKVLVEPDYIGAYALMDGPNKSHDLNVVISGSYTGKVYDDKKKGDASKLMLSLKDQKPMILNRSPLSWPSKKIYSLQ